MRDEGGYWPNFYSILIFFCVTISFFHFVFTVCTNNKTGFKKKAVPKKSHVSITISMIICIPICILTLSYNVVLIKKRLCSFNEEPPL